MLSSTTATESLNGQEIDYRFVDPAAHMQLWPDDEAEISITPEAVTRIAAKWRRDYIARRQKSPSADAEPTRLPQPANEPTTGEVEVLVVPQASTPDEGTLPSTSFTSDCYQAPPLSAMSVSIALPAGELPSDIAARCAAENTPTGDARLIDAWAGTEMHWSATCMRHRPLYFEEINAERYGYTMSYTLQPVISAARFFATIPALPYKMMIERPRDCIYTLGHYRPGSCVPRHWNRLPWKLTAGVVETGFIAGMILIIP